MFGFVRPAERELTAEQLNTFKSYYCGVCKSIEKNYSRAATATLTYDCAFLAMLLDSVATEAAPSKKIRCGIKERTAAYNDIINYCAAINVLLAYHKLEDDIKDSKSKKAKLAKAVLKGAYEKARLGNEKIDGLIISNLDYLSILEEENCDEPEMVADVFGKLLEGVFGVGSNMDKNIMGLGYNLGKYIYLVDAYTDYEKDIKQGEYNVFYLKYGKIDNLKEEVTFMLECILTDMIEFYENLQIKRNKKIIDNVLYIGILIEMLKSNKPLRKDK